MKANESGLDRAVRVALGIILGLLVAFKVVAGGLAIAIGIVAAIAIVTGVVGFCALYALFGLSTCNVAVKQ
jgi:hypothetical protein